MNRTWSSISHIDEELEASTVLSRWHNAIKEYVPRRRGSWPFHHRQECDPRAIDPQRSALRDTKRTCYLVGRYCARNRFAHGYTKCLASCTASASALSSCEVKGQPYQDAHGSNHQVNRAIRVRSQHGNIVIGDAFVAEIADQIIGTCENMLRDEAALGRSGDAVSTKQTRSGCFMALSGLRLDCSEASRPSRPSKIGRRIWKLGHVVRGPDTTRRCCHTGVYCGLCADKHGESYIPTCITTIAADKS